MKSSFDCVIYVYLVLPPKVEMFGKSIFFESGDLFDKLYMEKYCAVIGREYYGAAGRHNGADLSEVKMFFATI